MTAAARQTSSKMYGVSWDKQTNKWQAHASLNGKKVALGRSTSQKAAALAYDAFVRVPAAQVARGNLSHSPVPVSQLRKHNLHRGPRARQLNFPNPEASARNLPSPLFHTPRRNLLCATAPRAGRRRARRRGAAERARPQAGGDALARRRVVARGQVGGVDAQAQPRGAVRGEQRLGRERGQRARVRLGRERRGGGRVVVGRVVVGRRQLGDAERGAFDAALAEDDISEFLGVLPLPKSLSPHEKYEIRRIKARVSLASAPRISL